MPAPVTRRTFLHAAAAASAAVAQTSKPQPKAPVLSAANYTPADYPIVPKRYSEVKLKDDFWAPKVKTNVEVTIPFEVEKLSSSASAREFGGGVLEASILSLQTHP